MTTLPLTDGMQKDIVERAAGLIARAAAPKCDASACESRRKGELQ